MSRSGSRIPHRGGANPPGGRQHMILQNFAKNCMKLRKFLAVGGGGGACQVRPPKSAAAEELGRQKASRCRTQSLPYMGLCSKTWVSIPKYGCLFPHKKTNVLQLALKKRYPNLCNAVAVTENYSACLGLFMITPSSQTKAQSSHIYFSTIYFMRMSLEVELSCQEDCTANDK